MSSGLSTTDLSSFPKLALLAELYMDWQSLLPIAPNVAEANRNRCNVPGYSFVRHTSSSEILMFVDGSSLDNGLPAEGAGCGVVFAPLQLFRTVSKKMEIHKQATVQNFVPY